MSLTNGRIFAYTLSKSNVQHTTAYFLSRYLAKYIAGIDEGNMIMYHLEMIMLVASRILHRNLFCIAIFNMLQRSLAPKL